MQENPAEEAPSSDQKASQKQKQRLLNKRGCG